MRVKVRLAFLCLMVGGLFKMMRTCLRHTLMYVFYVYVSPTKTRFLSCYVSTYVVSQLCH